MRQASALADACRFFLQSNQTIFWHSGVGKERDRHSRGPSAGRRGGPGIQQGDLSGEAVVEAHWTDQRRGTIWVPTDGGRPEQQGATVFMAAGFGGTTGIRQQGAKKMPGPAKGSKGK